MIKNIIFDIGNVLVKFRPDEVFAECGAKKEDIEYLLNATVYSKWWAQWDIGLVPCEELKERMRKEVGDQVEVYDRFITEGSKELVRVFDYATPWIKELKNRGFKVYLLSNYPKELFEIHSKNMGFIPYVDGKIVSGFVHEIKPADKIYQMLLDEYGLNPEESVFFDDLEKNIVAAEKNKIHGIVFRGLEEAKAELEALLAI